MMPSVNANAHLAEMYHDAKAHPCADCGVHYPIHVMQLDHRPDVVKRFAVNAPLWPGSAQVRAALAVAIAELGSAEAVMRAEIAKCDVVCANCHAKRTYRRRIERLREQGRTSPRLGCLAGEDHCRHGAPAAGSQGDAE